MNYPFLADVDDTYDNGELRNRIRRALCRLELYSEARAMTIGLGTHGGEPNHLPPETQMKPKPGDKPPRERSLFERYYYGFSQCPQRPDPQWAFRLLCAHAERDLEHHARGLPAERQAGAVNSANALGVVQSLSGAALEREQGAEVVRDYEGAPAGEVAAVLQVSAGWVHKVRERRGRHPETGKPKTGWQGWDEETRFRKVQELKAKRHAGTDRPVSQQWVANKLGTSKRSVQRRWERMPQARDRAA